jgi:hypothetical protein
MKYLLPILISICSIASFLAARHLKPDSLSEAATAEQLATRPELKGLARRAERLSGFESATVADLEKLRRSGQAGFEDIARLMEQRTDGFDLAWNWIEDAGFNSSERELLFGTLANKWFDRDPEACLARIAALDYMKSVALAGRLLGKLFSESPEQAELVRKHLGTLVPLLGVVGGGMAELPPASPENMKLLLSLPEGTARTTLLRHFANRWIESDPAAAMAWLEGQPAEISSSVLERHAANMLQPHSTPSEAELKMATDWLATKASRGALSRLGPDWVATMAKTNPAAALEWAHMHLAADSLAEATGKAIKQMLAKDPASARQIVEDLPPGNLRHLAAYQVTEARLAEDPAEAVAWWSEQVDAKERSIRGSQGAPERLGEKWASLQPDSFRDRVANQEMPELPPSVLFAGVNQLMSQDRPGTFEWIAGMPEKQRPTLARAAYRSWAYEAPAEAAATFDARPELATGEAAGAIASSWYSKDRQAAVGWISTLPWGGPRESAIAKVKAIADFEVSLGGSFPEDLKKLLH